MPDTETVHESVKEYYGKTLQSSDDLKTGCCTAGAPPARHREILSMLDDEILTRFYGCGAPIPDALDNLTVIDLGCGTGRDCFLLSKLVGPRGQVIGVDMTEEQLEVGRRYRDDVMQRFGHNEPNVDFRKGLIEDLAGCGIEDHSVDLVISNCVLNLSPDKERVFSEIFRVLKPGGELYFSDVYSDRRIPEALKNDPVFHGECLGGALYEQDFRRLLADLGCRDYRCTDKQPISLDDSDLAGAAGMIRFSSITVRAFNLDTLEDRCEDYGQIATYKGTIPGKPSVVAFDMETVFETGRPLPVCGNTATMLTETRFARHFSVLGERDTHYGLFAACVKPEAVGVSDSGDCATSSSSCCG